MLKLHKIIRVSYLVACPIVFILFHDRDLQGEVLKLMKIYHFLVCSAYLVLFSKFLDRLWSGLC